MRYFLIEIDGDQEELFFRFNLPFIQENLSKGVNISLEEDLLSRGWSEICTGVHASVSGAFYERMLMDGSYTVSSEYKLLDELKVNTNIIPLWVALNANGYSVGIMNVPTTNIAPKVNGFFVSGGGVKLRNLSLEYLNRSQQMNNFLFNFSS
jgi:predicted AlkP superfamily phosphohydrolase/phosphomutase